MYYSRHVVSASLTSTPHVVYYTQPVTCESHIYGHTNNTLHHYSESEKDAEVKAKDTQFWDSHISLREKFEYNIETQKVGER